MLKIFTLVLLPVLLLLPSDEVLFLEKQPVFEHALVAYYVESTDSNKVIAAHQENKMLSPASVMKLLSTGVALEALGSDYQQYSVISSEGLIQGGELVGNLIVSPNFNPTLGASRFGKNLEALANEIVLALKTKGINSISGALKVVEPTAAFQRIPRTWIWEDMGNYYGAGVGACIWNENSLDLIFSSGIEGSATTLIKTDPDLPFLKIKNEVKASSINQDLAYAFSRPGDEEIVIAGTIPQNKNHFVVKAAIPNPAKTIAYLVTEALIKKGIKINKSPEVIATAPAGNEILKIPSATVAEIIAQTNMQSINIYAEVLLRLAYQKSGSSQNINEWFKKTLGEKINSEGALIYDASGLSRFNAVSPQQIVAYLKHLNKSQVSVAFNQSLAVAGRTGTLKNLLRNSPANGFIRGKSGSMSGVRAYAGFIEAKSGKSYTFAVLINNYEGSFGEIKPAIESWLLSLYER